MNFWNFMRKTRSSPAIPKVSNSRLKSVILLMIQSTYSPSSFLQSILYQLSLVLLSLLIFQILSIYLLMMSIVLSIAFATINQSGLMVYLMTFWYNLRDVLSFSLYLLFQKSLSSINIKILVILFFFWRYKWLGN